VAGENKWEELVAEAFKERNPERLKAIVEKLHRALDERAAKIRSSPLLPSVNRTSPKVPGAEMFSSKVQKAQ
jgi:hypothetical protein